jgi:hypothetical protein
MKAQLSVMHGHASKMPHSQALAESGAGPTALKSSQNLLVMRISVSRFQSDLSHIPQR